MCLVVCGVGPGVRMQSVGSSGGHLTPSGPTGGGLAGVEGARCAKQACAFKQDGAGDGAGRVGGRMCDWMRPVGTWQQAGLLAGRLGPCGEPEAGRVSARLDRAEITRGHHAQWLLGLGQTEGAAQVASGSPPGDQPSPS